MKSLDLKLIFSNSTNTNVSPNLLNQVARNFLYAMRQTGNFELDVSIVGSTKMRALNRQYRSVNKPTDVLSFPLIDSRSLPPITSHITPLGSIVICPTQVNLYLKNNSYPNISITGQKTTNYGILYVLTHGLMHLLEYDHRTDTSEAEFNKIIQSFFKRYYAYS